MVKCGPWTPKWIVIHKTNMRCVEHELHKKKLNELMIRVVLEYSKNNKTKF